MFKKTLLTALLVSAPLLMVGCSSTGDKGATSTGGLNTDAYGSGVDNVKSEFGEATLDERTFYFDFDKSDIKPEYMAAIEANGKNLANHPKKKVRVEGHTDERGSREYNIALGERRAQSIARVLMMEGARHDQISVVSYGAERPAVQGHNEAAWADNRRAIIEYEAGGQ